MLPVITATYTIDDGLLAMPFNVSTPVLFFDKNVLVAAGLDPDNPPTTLDSLRAANTQVVTSGAAAHGMVAYDGYGPWFVTQYNSQLEQLSGFPDNGRRGDAVTLVDFATPETIDSFQWLVDEVESGRALWIGPNSSGFDDLVRGVDKVDGAAFTINTSASTGDVLRLIEAGSFPGVSLGVSALPGPGVGALVGGGAFWLTRSTDASRVGSTFDYLDWLTQPAQHADFAAYTGFSPLRTEELTEPVLVDAWTEHPQLRVAYDQLEALPPTPVRAGAAWGAGTDINRVLYETMTAVIEGVDVQTQLSLATDEVNAILLQYNSTIED
jgi:sn-glycerol 3-phosphate transport system substrate-binding protein